MLKITWFCRCAVRSVSSFLEGLCISSQARNLIPEMYERAAKHGGLSVVVFIIDELKQLTILHILIKNYSGRQRGCDIVANQTNCLDPGENLNGSGYDKLYIVNPCDSIGG